MWDKSCTRSYFYKHLTSKYSNLRFGKSWNLNPWSTNLKNQLRQHPDRQLTSMSNLQTLRSRNFPNSRKSQEFWKKCHFVSKSQIWGQFLEIWRILTKSGKSGKSGNSGSHQIPKSAKPGNPGSQNLGKSGARIRDPDLEIRVREIAGSRSPDSGSRNLGNPGNPEKTEKTFFPGTTSTGLFRVFVFCAILWSRDFVCRFEFGCKTSKKGVFFL